MSFEMRPRESGAVKTGLVETGRAPDPYRGWLVTVELSGRQRAEVARLTGTRVRALKIVIEDLDDLADVLVHAGSQDAMEE